MLGKVQSKQPIQGIPVASIVLPQAPLSWSEDNNIALTSQLGLYIFDLHLSPNGDHPGLLFDRFFISTPDNTNPFIISGTPLIELVKEMDRTEAQSLMLDATISATHRAENELSLRRSHMSSGVGQGMGGDACHVGFRQAKWSPNGLSKQGCLICLVTYDHQISIVGQKGMRWVTVSNLTPIWYKHLTTESKKLLEEYQKTIGSYKHHKFIAQTKFLGVADITWTKLMSDLNDSFSYSYILMATTSMHLVVWRIPYFAGSLQPEIVSIISLEKCKEKISNISYFNVSIENKNEGYLFIGTIKGEIHIYFISFMDQVSHHFIACLNNAMPGMSTFHLVLTQLEDTDLYVLYCSKNNLFCCYLLCLSTFSCKILATTHAFTGCLHISGINVVAPNLIYVSSKDGNIKEFNMEIDVLKPSLIISKKELILTSEDINYDGFCTSPHKSIWAILTTVSSSYDHLILREPTIISIFQVNNLDTICNFLLTESSCPVAKHVDLFESVRLLNSMPPSLRESKSSIPIVNEEEINSLNFNQKITYLWFMEILLSDKETKSQREYIEKIRNKLLESALKDHILETISNFPPANIYDTSPQQRLSLYLMCSYLQNLREADQNLKTMMCMLKKSEKIVEEKCIVCNNKVIFDTVVSAKCSLGHTMPRCYRTLLATLPVLKCSYCNTFYLPDALQNGHKNEDKCILCSNTLKVKNRKRHNVKTIACKKKNFNLRKCK